MKLSEFSRLTGIKRTTLQLYDKEGILKPTEDSRNGYWQYDEKEIGTALIILVLKDAGFTLKEIKESLEGNTDFGELMDSAAKKIHERIAWLQGCLRYIDLVRTSAENVYLIEPIVSRLGVVNIMKKGNGYHEEREQYIRDTQPDEHDESPKKSEGKQAEDDDDISPELLKEMIQAVRAVFYISLLNGTEPPEGHTAQETLNRVFCFVNKLAYDEDEEPISRSEFSEEMNDILREFEIDEDEKKRLEKNFGKGCFAYIYRAIECYGASEEDEG